LLNALGFDWVIHDAKWEAMFTDLKRYKERFDDCNVPHNWSENPQLAKWVDHQRSFEKAGRQSPSRKARLNQLGFAWDRQDAAWDTKFTELRRYHERFGNCNVSEEWAENPQLGKWVGAQRVGKKMGTLSEERQLRLNEIGFIWDAHESRWDTKFTELRRCKELFGGDWSAKEWKDNPELGSWVREQRKLGNRGKLSADRKARLDALGFDWNPRANKRRSPPLAAE
jgi:Helicase associated domain